jgi:phosphate transport system substrate-binding protein
MAKFSRLTPVSRIIIIFAILGGLFFLVRNLFPAKNIDAQNNDASSPKSTAPVILTLSGSSTLGNNMIPQIAKQYMSLEMNAKEVKIQTITDEETNIFGKIDGIEKRIVILTQGSSQGVSDVQNQKADIAMLSGNTDDLPTDLRLSNVALDGIAILVNKANKINELNKTQINDIFIGKITNWSQVGGQSGLINVFSRNSKSGTYEAFKQLVLAPNATLPNSVKLFEESKQIIAAIESDPNAIGFSSFSSIGNTNALGLSDAGTSVHYPAVFTIQSEDYLLTRRLYLARASSNSSALVQRFIDFSLADDRGQMIVAESGFVNMNLHNTNQQIVKENAPPQYIAATSGANRLPTALHFLSGNATPDERATDDIKRIIKILAEPQNRQKKVILIGFTDNIGNPTQNLALSKQRAQSIQAEFAKFGLSTDVFGFGQALPVAANTNAVGQNKNRRVEVWMK